MTHMTIFIYVFAIPCKQSDILSVGFVIIPGSKPMNNNEHIIRQQYKIQDLFTYPEGHGPGGHHKAYS